MVSGKATEQATKNNLTKFSAISYKSLGGTGLFVSQAGFGCYRIDNASEKHKVALQKALIEGVNIIDTSANYGDGSSETLIGCVLHDLTFEEKLSRESVVIITKGGYIQGINYVDCKRMEQNNTPYPDVVEFAEGLNHCIHPDFLETQINLSMQRMNIDVIDVYLLHNPEYYLSKASTQGLSIKEAREEYYRRIKLAFIFLEEQVSKGKIQFYGVSSNTFGYDSDLYEFTSLEKLIEIAKEVSENNHFKVIELPLNLYEPGAVIEKNNNNDTKSVIDLALEYNIGVVINRPLNTIDGKQLIRLTEVTFGEVLTTEEIDKYITELSNFEARLKSELLSQVDLDNRFISDILNVFSFSEELLNSWKTFNTLDYWKNVMMQYFLPRLLFCKQAITEYKQLSKELWEYIDEGIQLGNNILIAITDYYKAQHSEVVDIIKQKLEKNNSLYSKNRPLSQNALRLLRCTKGVSSVLVGMRQEAYVDDVLNELQTTIQLENDLSSWEKLSLEFENS